MNLLIGVLVVLALVAAVAVARRLIGARSDEHAMESYEHALDVLGDASRRNETPRVRIVPPDEVARAHVRAAEGDTDLVPRPGAAADVPPPRIRLEPPVLPGVPAGHPPASGTPPRGTPAVAGPGATTHGAGDGHAQPADLSPAGGAEVPEEPAAVLASTSDDAGAAGAGAGAGKARSRRPRGLVDLVHERRVSRAATGGMAVVAAAAVAVAALQLAGSPTRPAATKGTVPGHGSSPQGPATTRPGSTTTTAPQVKSITTTTVPSSIVPETSSSTEVSYRAPAPTYNVTFQATTGPCWVGVQEGANGPWAWMETVQPGQTQTYQASGSVVVRLGAPTKIKVSVDGITVQLPPSNVQPYDLTFTPDS